MRGLVLLLLLRFYFGIQAVKHFLKLALNVVNQVINQLYSSDLTLQIKQISTFTAYLKYFLLQTVESTHNFF